MGKMLVFSSAVEGRDDEYNEWYNTVHLKEVCATDPFKSAQRFRIPDLEGLPRPSSHRYLAIYEFDGPPQAAINSLFAASPGMNISDALNAAEAQIVMVEDI
jgi:hypothetical protein